MLTSRMRLVAINDVYELGNLAKLQTFLSQLTPVPCAVLILGDFLSPSPLSSIDGGQGMVATLRAAGITHFTLGNHEADLPLNVIHARFQEFSKSAKFINTNVRESPPERASWLQDPAISHEHAIVRTPDDMVKVALTGFLSDEPDVFFDDKFKGVPISNVLDTFTSVYNKLVPSVADFCIPLTHQSLKRDRELAERMLEMDIPKGLIIGGHDHVPVEETVTTQNNSDSIEILKSGHDAEHASLIDLHFDASSKPPKLKRIESTLVDLSTYEDSTVVKRIADSHMAILDEMNDEMVLQIDADNLPPGKHLSSERTRFEQTTVGSFFCQAIKEELEADVALLNGGAIRGDTTYDDNKMSFAQLKKELPFPTKIVVVPMSRSEVQNAIFDSRSNVEESVIETEDGEIPRKGYLQVDLDMDLMPHTGDDNDIMKVALPRNLLNGFCKIQPLMDAGDRLKAEGRFPGDEDFIPAIDLVVRHGSKSRWFEIIRDRNFKFEDLDLNNDGVLDRYEVKKMLERFLSHEPPDFMIDHMIASIDTDENGVIDIGELSFLIATMEREDHWRKF